MITWKKSVPARTHFISKGEWEKKREHKGERKGFEFSKSGWEEKTRTPSRKGGIGESYFHVRDGANCQHGCIIWREKVGAANFQANEQKKGGLRKE